MNRFKKEDVLAQLAFGDVSDTEAAQLEREAASDPELMALLTEYRDLRDGLRSLANIPDHQLSNERLRDAILGQGLKPNPVSRFDWSWLWMSGAAAAAAVIMFVGVNRMHTGEPKIVGGVNMPVASTFDTSLQNPATMVMPHPGSAKLVAQNTAAKKSAPAAHATTVVFHPVARLHRHRAHRDSGASLAGLYAESFAPGKPKSNERVASASGMPAPAAASEGLAPDSSAALKPVDSTPDNSPVVVIEPDQDQNTGAQRATEVGAATNVVVGG